MDMTEETQMRIDTISKLHDTYRYKGKPLGDKTLIAFIGPTAVGKSTLVNECLRQCRLRSLDAGECGTTTTRQRRENDDPANYITATEGVTINSMIQQIEQGMLINWSVHGTGQIYGTLPQNIDHTYNFLPLMPDSLPMMQRAGFRRVIAIYLIVAIEQWKHQLTERQDDPRYVGRMHEAFNSLVFAQNNTSSLIFMNNTAGESSLESRATSIIDALVSGKTLESDPKAMHVVESMKAFAKEVIDGNT